MVYNYCSSKCMFTIGILSSQTSSVDLSLVLSHVDNWQTWDAYLQAIVNTYIVLYYKLTSFCMSILSLHVESTGSMISIHLKVHARSHCLRVGSKLQGKQDVLRLLLGKMPFPSWSGCCLNCILESNTCLIPRSKRDWEQG